MPYAYGMEDVHPLKVEDLSLRIHTQVELEEAYWLQARYKQLNLIEHKRPRAIFHSQAYQRRMS